MEGNGNEWKENVSRETIRNGNPGKKMFHVKHFEMAWRDTEWKEMAIYGYEWPEM